jgi:trehalose-6-phosphate synthase
MLTANHIGIEPKLIHTTMRTEKFMSERMLIREKYRGKKVIFGVDKAHRLTGVNLKLNAIRKYLSLNPSLRKKLVLVQILEKSRHCSEEAANATFQDV